MTFLPLSRKVCPLPNPLPQTGEGIGSKVCALRGRRRFRLIVAGDREIAVSLDAPGRTIVWAIP